jgi:hypothetical protein
MLYVQNDGSFVAKCCEICIFQSFYISLAMSLHCAWFVIGRLYLLTNTNEKKRTGILPNNRPFQGLFRHIAWGAKHWGKRDAKPWLPYILLMSER